MVENWKIGDLIQGRWEIHRTMQGGMGAVYIVYDRQWKDAFAAKTFQDEVFTRNPSTKARFEKEATAWINLDLHPNITEARFLHVIDGKPFLFLEHVAGGDLSRWIGTHHLTNNPVQVLRFGIQFCDGMRHVISKGLKAHRDIKPQNCLVTENGILKVTDFGLAKILDDAVDLVKDDSSPDKLSVGLSQTGTAAGTCTHMSPEQFEDAKHVDVRADVYSFGVLVFQMIAGELPFLGRTFRDYAALHMKATVPIQRIPNQRIRGVVGKCLRKNPCERYSSFDELRDELAAAYKAENGFPAPDPIVGDELTASHLVNKGNALGSLGRMDDSLACFDKAISLSPLLAEAWLNKGATLFEQEKNVEALACFDRALALKPDLEGAWSNKGRVLGEMDRHEDAVTCYANAVRLNPNNSTTWFNMGHSIGLLGRHNDVVKCCARALQIHPDYSPLWILKGLGFVSMELFRDAMDCFQHAEKLGDTSAAGHMARCRMSHAEWYFRLGSGYQQEGNNAEAINCYEKGLTLNPDGNAIIWSNKGAALLALKRNGEAVTCFDRAIVLKRADWGAWNNKGIALFFMEQYAAALPVLEEAQRLGATRCASMIAVCRDKLRKR
jgi:tetratricopeptide (TPR) repeat protein